MAYLLNLIEEGARPAVLTRRIDLQATPEVQLRLYVDVTADDSRPISFRRSLVIDAEQPTSSTQRQLVAVGLLRCRMELGSFQVTFHPTRQESTAADQAPGGSARWRVEPPPKPVNPLAHDPLDISFDEVEAPRPEPAPRPVTGPAPAYSIGALMNDGTVRPLNREERPESGARYRIVREVRSDGTVSTLPRPVTLELAWSDEESQEFGRVKRGTTGNLRGNQVALTEAWIVPRLLDTLLSPFARLQERVRAGIMKAGLTPNVFVMLSGAAALILAGASYSMFMGQVADKAEEERNAALEDSKRQASAAQGAQAREQQCVEEIALTSRASGETKNADQQEARSRLQPGLAEIEYRREAGEPPGLLLRDRNASRQRLAQLLSLIVDRRQARMNDELTRTANRQRLQFGSQANPDLPVHVLLFHTFPKAATVSGFQRQGNEVDFRGAFGLSSRVLREFSARDRSDDARQLSPFAEKPADSGDLRDRDDWSASTHLEGLRRVRRAILTSDTGGRAAAYPEQLHLWAFALWFGYNHMADLKPGRVPSVAACVEGLVLDLAVFRLSEPGSEAPVLPNITDIINAQAWTGGPVSSSALCPWREERLFEGAKYAVDSVADEWIMGRSSTAGP